MRRTTALMAMWKAETKKGESLHFENCKGGYFSALDEYGLKVVGRTAQNTLSGKNLFDINYCVSLSGNTPYLETNELGELIVKAPCWHIDSSSIACFTVPGDGYYYLTLSRQSEVSEGIKFKLYDKTTGQILLFSSGCFYAMEGDQLSIRSWNDAGTNLGTVQIEKGKIGTEWEHYCGGIPSPNPNYPQPILCVKKGSVITCGNSQVITPCELYEGDIWYPISGKVEKHNFVIDSYAGETVTTPYVSTTGELTVGAKVVVKSDTPVTEQYEPQPIFASQGTVDILQQPTDLIANLEATVLAFNS